MAGLLAAGTAEACEITPGVVPRGRAEGSGVVVAFETRPPRVEVGQHFTLDVRTCAEGAAPRLTRIDADMPEHRHGMNYRPSLSATGDGRYAAEGLLFHMPGRWRLSFDLEREGRRLRLTSDLVVE
jgi:hypothetical protein